MAARSSRGRGGASRIGAAGVLVLLFSMLLSVPAIAGPSSSSPSPNPPHQRYCAILVGPASGPDADSPVLAEACSDRSAREARERMHAAASVTSSDQLMTWFQHANFEGAYTNIFGSAGPCDSAGYRVVPQYWWQVNLTSIAGFGLCDTARIYTRSLTYAQTFFLPSTFIGNILNDNVGRIQIYRR